VFIRVYSRLLDFVTGSKYLRIPTSANFVNFVVLNFGNQWFRFVAPFQGF